MKRLLALLITISLLSSAFAAGKGVSFLRSMVIPGYSQVASGRNYGYAMMASEATIIGGLVFFNEESDLLLQESYEYAIKFAHLTPGSYDNDFFTNISKFESSGYDANGYNAMVRKTALEQFPYDPIAQQEYIDANSYGEDKYWSWDNPSNRSAFNKLRNDSQDYEDYAKVAVGVLILNHLISGIDVLRYSSEAKRSHVYFKLKQRTPMMVLSYQW